LGALPFTTGFKNATVLLSSSLVVVGGKKGMEKKELEEKARPG
jgi:hypothetical protein